MWTSQDLDLKMAMDSNDQTTRSQLRLSEEIAQKQRTVQHGEIVRYVQATQNTMRCRHSAGDSTPWQHSAGRHTEHPRATHHCTICRSACDALDVEH